MFLTVTSKQMAAQLPLILVNLPFVHKTTSMRWKIILLVLLGTWKNPRMKALHQRTSGFTRQYGRIVSKMPNTNAGRSMHWTTHSRRNLEISIHQLWSLWLQLLLSGSNITLPWSLVGYNWSYLSIIADTAHILGFWPDHKKDMACLVSTLFLSVALLISYSSLQIFLCGIPSSSPSHCPLHPPRTASSPLKLLHLVNAHSGSRPKPLNFLMNHFS